MHRVRFLLYLWSLYMRYKGILCDKWFCLFGKAITSKEDAREIDGRELTTLPSTTLIRNASATHVRANTYGYACMQSSDTEWRELSFPSQVLKTTEHPTLGFKKPLLRQISVRNIQCDPVRRSAVEMGSRMAVAHIAGNAAVCVCSCRAPSSRE